MMGRALLIVGAIATLGLMATAVVSWAGLPFHIHMLIALGSSLLLLFSHSWIMFYLIGTGKAIKEAVKEHGLEEELAQETADFKNRSFPAMMLAMALAMTTFIIGAPVYTKTLPVWLHHVLFWLTLAAQLRALWIEQGVISANDRLMAGIDQRISGTSDGAA